MQTRRHLWLIVALSMPLLLNARPAAADADDTINLIAGATRMHDDNLFRVPSNARPEKEEITVTSLKLKVSKPYSLQRFELEASLIDYRYQNFSYLSYSAKPYKAAWLWSLTPYLHGNLSTEHNESLNSFTDITNRTIRNLNTRDNIRFDAVADLSGSWHLLGGVSQYTTENSQIVRGEADNRIDRTEAGLRHIFPSGSTLSYIARSGRGDYFNRAPLNPAPDNFDENENEVRLIWALTGKTRLDARLAYLDRQHNNKAGLDFDYAGIVGNLNANWNISGKTFLVATLARELGSYQTLNSTHHSTDRFTLGPYWQFSSKTALRGNFDYAQRDYLGTPGALPASNRSDTLRTAMIALEWQPLRSVTISSSLSKEQRDSNQPGFDYKSTTVGVTAQLTL
jgi:exopolysaccharide biosynthesis operon protein EpsL